MFCVGYSLSLNKARSFLRLKWSSCVLFPQLLEEWRGGDQIKNPAYVDGVLPVGNKTEVKNLVVKASQVERPAI